MDQFASNIKANASNKGLVYDLAPATLKELYKRPCQVCNRSDRVRTHRNVALSVYKVGYKDGNVRPVCSTCHKIRHGLGTTKLCALAAHTLLNCPLTKKALGASMGRACKAARALIARRAYRDPPSTRSYSTNYNTYRCSAKKRCGTDNGRRCPSSLFTLTRKDFESVRHRACFYCGLENSMGIDRLYPAIGYTEGNSVPCCKTCNYTKNDLHPGTYIQHLATIARHWAGLHGA